MRFIAILILLGVIAVPAIAVNINVTVADIGQTYINWQWDAGYNLTHILIDGVEICGYETTNNSIIRSGLEPNSLHSINVTNGSSYGDNITITLPDSPIILSNGNGEGVGAIFGLIGGLIGGILILNRGSKS